MEKRARGESWYLANGEEGQVRSLNNDLEERAPGIIFIYKVMEKEPGGILISRRWGRGKDLKITKLKEREKFSETRDECKLESWYLGDSEEKEKFLCMKLMEWNWCITKELRWEILSFCSENKDIKTSSNLTFPSRGNTS